MNEKSNEQAGRRQRIKRILKLLAGSLLAVIALMFVLLPAITGIILKSHLRNNGYTEAAIGNIDLNLFSGHLVLEEFHAAVDASRSIDIDKLELDLSPFSLFNKTVKINRLTITGPHINLQQQADGSISAGYQAASAEENIDTAEPQAESPAADSTSEWRIDLRELAINDLQLKLQNSDNSASFTSSLDFLLEQLRIDADGTLNTEYIAIRNYRFMAQDIPVLEYQELAINRINSSPAKLEIGSINLNDVTATIWRLANADFIVASTAVRFTAADKPAAEKPEIPPQSNKPVAFALGQFTFSGNNRIRLKDESILPKLDTDFTIKKFDIGTINSADPKLNTPVNFRMIRDKYDAISITGTITAFHDNPGADLALTIKDFDITPFSPYMVNAIGYKAKTGQLNLENKLAVKNNLISSNNKIRLHHFTVEIGDPEKAEIFEDEIKISLETALYFIRDDDDNVELEIPIDGKLDDPQFNIGPIVRQAMGKALQGASLTYLTYALQPWGALYMIGQKVGGSNDGVQLEAVVFAAGDAVLNDPTRNYLAKIAGLLTKKEKLKLTICPISTAVDAEFLNGNSRQPMTNNLPLQALDALSKQRAESVKNYFAEQRGIAPDRLYICAPHHETVKNIKPQVTLSF